MKYIEEMSRKGISYKKFNSTFGAKILEKFGWKEGEGLGKTKNGITEAIQIKRREENIGLGKTQKEVTWNDKWWEQSYNNILKNILMFFIYLFFIKFIYYFSKNEHEIYRRNE